MFFLIKKETPNKINVKKLTTKWLIEMLMPISSKTPAKKMIIKMHLTILKKTLFIIITTFDNW